VAIVSQQIATGTVAVVAHSGKTLGDGLLGLRRELERRGVEDPIWREVSKSRKAPPQVERALEHGADLLFVWGGDGMVQRCVDVLAGSNARLAILPAGTANLLATNLGIPKDIGAAVDIGLHGDRRAIDVGRMKGERFAVMAGAGFDAAMIREADGGLKDRFGRVAYVWTGSKSLRAKPFRAKISVDGSSWYNGKASCILLGNVGDLFGGIEAFEDASPDDGMLELGVVAAEGVAQWMRTIARTAVGTAGKSPFVQVTKARSVEVVLNRKVLYELDGGDRAKVKKFKVKVEPGAVTVCVPQAQR
jgi:diacylglycerol kinase (ATP)